MVQWTRQFPDQAGTTLARAVDARGDVYVVGTVYGALPGQTNGYRNDAFVRKYSADGALLWTRQFDLHLQETASGVAVDSTGVYVVGDTSYSSANQGDHSTVFLRKYTAGGDEVWTQTFAFNGVRISLPSAVALGPQGIYVSGSAGSFSSPGGPPVPLDGFVLRYDRDGTLLDSQRFGAAGVDDAATGIAVNASGVYISGWTDGALSGQVNRGGRDAFVRKLDASDAQVWTRQFGTSADDQATGVALRSDGVYVSGWTDAALSGQHSAGRRDAFVRSYAASGALRWTDQFGTAANDQANAIDANTTGVYVAGDTDGELPGEVNRGDTDAFARKYSGDGSPVWTNQFGVRVSDTARGVAADGNSVYVVGDTSYQLNGSNLFADRTAYVTKLVQQPASCTLIRGDLIVHNAADVARIAKIRGCFDVEGGVFVQRASGVTNLDFLSGLRLVGGYVGIADNLALTSLAGLEHLQAIGEGLVIEGNPVLTSATSFDSLATVAHEIHIFGNPALQRVGLPVLYFANDQLFTANGALRSIAAPSLVTSGHSLRVEHHDRLRRLNLGALRYAGLIALRFNRALTDVTLPELLSAHTVDMLRNPSLQRVSLPRVSGLDTLTVTFNSALQSVSLPVIEQIDTRVVVDHNAALETLALPQLQLITVFQNAAEPDAGLIVTGNASLGRLELASLFEVSGSITIRQNAALEAVLLPELFTQGYLSLNGPEGAFVIGENPSLTTVDVSKITDAVRWEFVDNPRLTDIVPLRYSARVSVFFEVINNASLTTLQPFHAIQQVLGDVRILNNDELPTCEAQALINAIAVITGSVEIRGNLGTCP